MREQLGERPSLDEYCRRFPGQATMLMRQVELHQALTSVKRVGADEEDVPRTYHTPLPEASLQSAPVAIPGFEIVGILGRGGMGVVYEARQLSLDRLVALKVLDVKPESDPTNLDRIRREARVTARLGHPHIITVYDAGSAESGARDLAVAYGLPYVIRQQPGPAPFVVRSSTHR